MHRLQVVVPTPAHASLEGPLDYLSELPLAPGTLVRVPLARREVLGLVWDGGSQDDAIAAKAIAGALAGIAPLSKAWRQLVAFAASYYQRGIGELALAALPPQLRDLDATQLGRRLKRAARSSAPTDPAEPRPEVTPQQQAALDAVASGDGTFLLFGATGSGKTEVYLRAVEAMLARNAVAQALVMVPEINLTPQLQQRFAARFGEANVVAMHSGMTPAQRLRSWLAAHNGTARVVLGTRMAVFASLDRLGLIVVDEEHDPSYKQQEGARYSARDLAIYRGHLEKVAVVLGSATPSLESWHAAAQGRYRLLPMPERVGQGTQAASFPAVRLVDMNMQPPRAVFSPPLLDAIGQRVARGEQSLVFLNRRGYAPVLACSACDWKSECPNCSAYRVFHKVDRTLRCHHCGFAERVPRACPLCGNVDITTVGRGTERLEEHLGELLDAVRRPDGTPVRIARIDADTTRLKGSLESQLAQVHAGDVDVLVGTQMVTKGHDFRGITLVAALSPDTALFSGDFRATERLFSLLLQAAGRAGRDAQHAGSSEMWVQTFNPQHPLFAALRRHDFPAFAQHELGERQRAGMPPFGFQALLRAEARTQEAAQAWLNEASAAGGALSSSPQVTLYSAVPMGVQRVANVERAQMLVESPSRVALQRFLGEWRPHLRQLKSRGIIRWAVDVDPLQV